jgi:hypothetical protein
MQPTGTSRRRALWAVAGLILGLAGLGVALPWAGSTGTAARASDGQVYSIELPYEEPTYVPDGPHVAAFTAYCRLCHTPRLVLTQPRLTEKKWGEVVKKMVVTYGAQIPPEQEPLIVQYLMAVRGP